MLILSNVQAASVPPSGNPSGTTSASASGATSTAKLHTLAKAAGKLYFGTATDNPELTDTAYTAILDDNTMFGQISPANSMKWVSATFSTVHRDHQLTTLTARMPLSLSRACSLLPKVTRLPTLPRRMTCFCVVCNSYSFAITPGLTREKQSTGHNCVWYNQLPSWVSSGSFTAAQLTSVIQNHCSTLVSHYKGQVYAWDVVNEPFNDDGTWRTDVFFNVLGETYPAIALNAARTADPNAKLYINEYNIEFAGAKATSLLNLVQTLKSQNTPLDGVGFQCHFIVGEFSGPGLQTQLSTFAATGVEVAITELDIRMTLPSTPALLAQQKTDYNSVITACMGVEECVGVTVWDWTDKYSWVPSTFSGQGAACPWDEVRTLSHGSRHMLMTTLLQNFVKKPAYDGIATGFSS